MAQSVYLNNDNRLVVPDVRVKKVPVTTDVLDTFVWVLYDPAGEQVATGSLALAEEQVSEDLNDFEAYIPSSVLVGQNPSTSDADTRGRLTVTFGNDGADGYWEDSVRFKTRKFGQ